MRKIGLAISILLYMVACTYEHLERHLGVSNGIGTGYYLYGQVVEITAFPPEEGKLFDRWTGDTAFVDLRHESPTQFFMPNRDITLVATYRDAPVLISYRSEVRPIIRRSCAKSTCHDPTSVVFPLTTYQQVSFRSRQIRSVLLSGRMPLDDALPQNELDLIIGWIDQGALDN